MGANAFVAARVVLDVSFDAARCRLGRLARDGVLLGASEYAYGAGATGLAPRAFRIPGGLPGRSLGKPTDALLVIIGDADV